AAAAPPVSTPPPQSTSTGASSGRRKPILIGAAILAVVVVAGATISLFALSGSSTDDGTTPSTTVRAQVPSASRETTTPSTTATTRPPAPGDPQPTIATYITDNGISETAVHKGDPGAPVIDVPVPAGWSISSSPPDWAYEVIVSDDAQFAGDPPSVAVLMSKLDGDVDAEELLAHAPGELLNLPGYQGGTGEPGELDGYSGAVLGGTYTGDGGDTRSIAQKTVVIPASDGVYVLQMNANGPQAAQAMLDAATATIDSETTITF
ncbi:LpqN/LpqT family lipoprotein, partial [Micrococcus luteus]|uniref:LpqN/LpqT family lipoprotein n=1 Tax=Micrococcus luteus TaxID=1270 RepID=UPI00343C6BE2